MIRLIHKATASLIPLFKGHDAAHAWLIAMGYNVSTRVSMRGGR